MELVREALRALGIDRLVFGIHDACFPSVEGEDHGQGAPASRGARDLLAFVAGLGFDGVQLGPQGETTDDDPSPYDGATFARSTRSIAFAELLSDERFRDLLDEPTIAPWLGAPRDRVDHLRAGVIARALLDALHARFAVQRPREVTALLDAFRDRQRFWLERDALWEALAVEHGGVDFEHWSSEIDRTLFAFDDSTRSARRIELETKHRRTIERWELAQLVAHLQHQRVRDTARALGLRLYADLQIGWSRRDAWAFCAAFLGGYRMGAPPSRTNPDGQPWGYPLLHPEGENGARELFVARLEKVVAEHDGLRIDHPHGLVCPWVYRERALDPFAAVRQGARLHESPDLPDHPELARFAYVRPEQLERSVPRHADGWVRVLDPEQVERYARNVDAIVARVGRKEDVVCEVLSTMPFPLGEVLRRHRLGRFRVTQKVGLHDPRDVYRSENAAPEDWVLVGNHDTETVWSVAERWVREGLGEAHAEYLAERLRVEDREAFVRETANDARALANAKLAELFVGPARHVFVWWGDVFGETARYNVPGTVTASNWILRVPSDFRRVHQERVASRSALDLPRALAVALRARGEHALADALRKG